MKLLIDFLNKRGFINAFTEGADQELDVGKAYMGIDPTADSLHLGHLVGILALKWLQKFNIEVVVVVGGATGMIGDPSGKNTERSLLDYETLKHNVGGISKCLQKFLGVNVQVLNNYDWLSTFSFLNFLRDIGKHFRIASMMSKESVKQRCSSEAGISFTEFSYQILQAYDFLHLFDKENVKIQIGGSDQWGNITAGTDLIRRLRGKHVGGITFSLLTKKDGTKFGKSSDGTIWLDAEKTSPYDFYQYLYRSADTDIPIMLRLLTLLPEDVILAKELEASQKTSDPNLLQKFLAEEVTKIVHGEEGLKSALETTAAMAPGTSTELSIENLELLAASGHVTDVLNEQLDKITIIDLMILCGSVSGKGVARRLIESDGIYLNNEKIVDFRRLITPDDLLEGRFLMLGLGRKKKFLLRVQRSHE
ncbi:Tyrosine--tRNA ligase [Candidatus Clavichlamydia salmonicola]|uniref:tyrosine--tRNA ligase n=1 Tax=Candidatus Clavichlamydia salmonicola TaxID=469812 RepID=UPI0018910A4C|nr:tyrosine--tRNA ligase [Candidatus Clavichlamydia salmonicola]MBF5051125.1 Tyrosine--tRNA ligase [Candidatus Clavichlamydia salmonicola]